MLEISHAGAVPQVEVSAVLLSGANAPSKEELLGRAKAAIEASGQSLHDAAEALATAQELHGASQAEMARAVGKSEAWISMLLRWGRSGYKDESPFGPTTKAGRLKHAKDRVASGASKPRKPRKAEVRQQTNGDDPQASADKRKAENATLLDEPESATSAPELGENPADGQSINSPFTGDQAPTCCKPSPAKAKEELKYAIDHWWRYLDDAGKREVIDHFLDKVDRWDGAADETPSVCKHGGNT
jgi:hypothetical protein